MSKGSKNRTTSKSLFDSNYSIINWGKPKELTCFNCGERILKSDLEELPLLFIVRPDGQVLHKDCNFHV